jgi:carboxyl-terminal processing protease
MMPSPKTFRAFALWSFSLLLAFGLGYHWRASTLPSAAQESSSAFPLLDEAVQFVEANFVKPQPDPVALEYEVIRGYLGALGDPNTFFIEPAVAASESQALAGRYGGVGVDVKRNEAGELVLYPFPDSPALAAGIREGDILLSINGQALILEQSLDEIRQALRGEIVEGAGVQVVVRNQAESEEREYFIPFAEILVPSVTWRPLFEAPEIGYVQISNFTSRTPDELTQAIRELEAAGITALILDLRNNRGGLLQESLTVADSFVDGGVLSIERRVSGENTKLGVSGGLALDLPLVVLVNANTASASEIVAGAIQSQGRGILIGQQTFGKGSIQSIFQLSDSSSIHVTVALWFTPDNAPIDGLGLTPDLPMIPDENGRDVELGEAIRYLQQERAAN